VLPSLIDLLPLASGGGRKTKRKGAALAAAPLHFVSVCIPNESLKDK
jgi:hypothetical protein